MDVDTFTNALTKVKILEDGYLLKEETEVNAVRIAYLKRDMEDSAIQAVYRDAKNVMFLRNQRVLYMDKTYGHKIGICLWDHSMLKLEACYSEEQANSSREWWTTCNIPPPSAEDYRKYAEDDETKYW